MKLTHQLLHSAGTYSGSGFNKHQLELLGVAWPPPRGWLKKLVGTEIPDDEWEKVVALKGVRDKSKRDKIVESGIPDTLDDWLDNVTVSEVDDYHNEANNGKLAGILGWYMVADETGVNAYFSTETAALRHRLDYINRKLNP
jgi:Mor family transcriptional regulator